MEKQITAVDWLVENLYYMLKTEHYDIIDQAKAMEKEQIRFVYMQGQDAILEKFNLRVNRRINSLQYYNETFKNK